MSVIKYRKTIILRKGDLFSNFSVTTGEGEEQVTKWYYGIKGESFLTSKDEMNNKDLYNFFGDERIKSIGFTQNINVPNDEAEETIPVSSCDIGVINWISSTSNNPFESTDNVIKIKDGKVGIQVQNDNIVVLKDDEHSDGAYDSEDDLNAAKETYFNDHPEYNGDYSFTLTYFMIIDIEDLVTEGELPASFTTENPVSILYIHKNDGSVGEDPAPIIKPIEEGPIEIQEVLNSDEYSFVKKHKEDADYTYTFREFSFEMNGPEFGLGEYKTDVWWGEQHVYANWDQTEAVVNNVAITVHKNNGSDDVEVVEFDDNTGLSSDDIDYSMILDRLSEEFKTRNADNNFEYTLAGISLTDDGEIINITSHKFTESRDVYLIWDKTPIIPENAGNDDYVKSGRLQMINGILFVTPEDSESVKKIEFVNDHYYILCTNNHIYKLDTAFNIVNDLNLTGYNTDPAKNDIIVSDTVLIIKAGNYILTDKETVKNNFGINDSNLVVESQNLNTKTIVKINVK